MYDLLVLTFNEKRYSRLRSDKIRVKATNKVGRKRPKYYHELWPLINNCHGILYKLFTKENLGEFECCDEMFEFSDSYDADLRLQKWIPFVADECVADWVSIKLNADYDDEFVAIIDKLLSCSPISTIAFLCRGQSVDREVVVGTLTRNEFMQLLCSGNIRTNVCYLIKNDLSA